MQVVNKELTLNWIKSKVAKAKIVCRKSLNAKSNLAKWNLIGGIQFKHTKNCLMFMQCNDWVCFD